MKHDLLMTSTGVAGAVAEIRAYVPDPRRCTACEMHGGDCTRPSFDQMPLLGVYPDGVAFVACSDFSAEGA